jgi:hypothetical protein
VARAKIVLTNGVCLQAVGSGQSLRGIKHFDFRPDCLLLDDVEGDIGASTPLEREATKKWFFGTVLPSLASRSIIRMAATPLDQECLPVTLGKMPTWRTMVVPVRSMGGNEDAFFEPWLAEQGIDVANTALTDMPHVIEEQRPAKSFDFMHGGGWPSEPKHGPERLGDRDADEVSETEAAEIKEAKRLANAERQRRYRERKKVMAEAKSGEPAPSPPVEPGAQRELSEVERAMAWRPPR